MNRQGFALVTVLWAILLLSTAAMLFSISIRQTTHTAANLGGKAQVDSAINAGLNLALEHILLARKMDHPIARAWRCRFGTTDLAIAISDEAARLDLNALSKELMTAILVEIGISSARATAMGAQWSNYRLKSANRLASIDELGRIDGFSRQIVEQLRPALSIHKKRPGIDPKIAVPLAQAAMDRMLSQEKDKLTIAEQTQLYFRSLYLPSNATVFRVHVSGIAYSGAKAQRVAIVRLDDAGLRLTPIAKLRHEAHKSGRVALNKCSHNLREANAGTPVVPDVR